MPKTRREMQGYLFRALLFFSLGAAALTAVAHFYPRWLEDFGWIPAPWDRVANALLGGMIAGGLYTGGVWMARWTEAHGRGGVGALFNIDLYTGYLILGPLLFFPAVVIAVKRLLSGELPEEEAVRFVRQSLPRRKTGSE